MLLVIDGGNTNVVFAVYDGHHQVAMWRISTQFSRTEDEYAVWLLQAMATSGLRPADIKGCAISNVVPHANRALENLATRYFGVTSVSVRDAISVLDIPVRLSRPDQVGADRLANAISAHRDYPGALIIIDFGTATTFDLVDPDGGYSGGIIAPGINLSMEALYNAAALLPRIVVEKPQCVIGHDTVSAMQSGVFWGYIGMIEGMISRIKAERGSHHTVLATGGLAPLFHGTTHAIDHVEPELTLKGLILLYEAVAAAHTDA